MKWYIVIWNVLALVIKCIFQTQGQPQENDLKNKRSWIDITEKKKWNYMKCSIKMREGRKNGEK